MTSLLPFVFETMRQRAIDPSSTRFFLPEVLGGLSGDNSQGKLLPLEEDPWDVGELKNVANGLITTSFCDQWATILNFQRVDMSNQTPIASPDSPYPTLVLGDDKHKVVITGLNNLYVDPAQDFEAIEGGFRATIKLKFNFWDGTDQRPSMPMLSFASSFLMSQKLCTADLDQNGDPAATCNGNESITVNGAGTIEVQVNDAYLDAVADITTAAGKGLQIKLVSLNLHGADESTPPKLNVKSLNINTDILLLKGAWQGLTEQAINSEDGRRGIFGSMNAALNEPSNLTTIGDEMTSKLSDALDGIMGKPATPLPAPSPGSQANPADEYMFARIIVALNQPGTELFLPQLISQNQNPSLSPLSIATISLGSFTVMGLPFNNNQLTNVSFNGLSNLKVPADSASIATGKLQFEALLGGWNPPPPVTGPGRVPAPPATGSADFALHPVGSQALTGKLNITVQNTTVESLCEPSGSDASSLNLNLKSMQMQISNPTSQITVDPKIDSSFESFIKKAVNTDDMLTTILQQINSEIAKNLAAIDLEVSKYLRDAISKGLQ